MNLYRIVLKPRAERDLDALPIEIARRIWRKLEALETNPRPPSAAKLVGEEGAYRIRVGDYRVVVLVNDSARLVEVVRVAHRREVYR